ncbi:MAG: 2-hydroxyacyl-CoA dehydratase, partial [Coriobacteriia bacterium]|nr:2-hydroxyacyl-CoA dehydratase [Coriobacteriia bacterium]
METDIITTAIDSLMDARLRSLEEAHDNGKKVVGYLPGGYVPDELIYASGAIPLCLSHGGDARPAEEGLSLTPNIICPFARAQIGETWLQTNPLYEKLDLIVVPCTCQHLKQAGDVWEYYEKVEVFKLGVPYDNKDAYEIDYFRDRLLVLKERLESLTGNEITDARLTEAIALYNRLRGLLKTLSLTRREPRPRISALDFVRLNHVSMYADPVMMCETLEAVIGGLPEVDVLPVRRPRVMLAGPALAFGDDQILKMAATAGVDVVIEDIFEGIRDYGQVVDGDGAPLDVLARSYLIRERPAAFMRGATRKRVDRVLELIADFDVQGVLWYQLLCCELYDEES